MAATTKVVFRQHWLSNAEMKTHVIGSLLVRRYHISRAFCQTDNEPRARLSVTWIGLSPSFTEQPRNFCAYTHMHQHSVHLNCAMIDCTQEGRKLTSWKARRNSPPGAMPSSFVKWADMLSRSRCITPCTTPPCFMAALSLPKLMFFASSSSVSSSYFRMFTRLLHNSTKTTSGCVSFIVCNYTQIL